MGVVQKLAQVMQICKGMRSFHQGNENISLILLPTTLDHALGFGISIVLKMSLTILQILAISSSAGMGVGQQFNSLYVHVHMYSFLVQCICTCIVVVQCYPGLDFNFSLFYLLIFF